MSAQTLSKLGISQNQPGCAIGAEWRKTNGTAITARSPIDGAALATVASASKDDVAAAVAAAHHAFLKFRLVPAPRRGELVRRYGEKLRQHKQTLAELVTLEAGKITSESLGEVQEMIDIADYAVGLSRQLYGLTIASERPGHRMMEQWHPLGAIGVITAFNFPVAVWAWNAMIALVCGDTVVWKPSEKTPLTAVACHNLLVETIREMNDPGIPADVSCVVIGDRVVGEAITSDPRVPLVSATGSVRMGKEVAKVVAARLGRTLLELGGNNGMILAPTADLELGTRAIVFAAAGTAGQRCTTLRRLIVHKSVYPEVVKRISTIFAKLKIGDPRAAGVLVGPLIDEAAFKGYEHALDEAKKANATIHNAGRVFPDLSPGQSASAAADSHAREKSYYVKPALVEIDPRADIVRHETFAPILYTFPYENLDDAIALHNSVPQGLSSAIFTGDVREAELFLSPAGSDCGIANVNIGTSGAEIGGAFGGEKETGGGRESGSDSWKAYMRRATNTINYSRDLPLAQGVSFDV